VRAASRAWLVAAFVVTGVAFAVEERAEPVVVYGDDRLTVRVGDMPLGDLLAELGRQTGAEIRGRVARPHGVTVAFDKVPLPQALHRLLGDQNFTLTYGDGGRLKVIELLGEGGAPVPPARSASPSAPPPTEESGPAARMLAAVERHTSVPLSGVLSETLGAERASLRQLFDLATREEDPVIRSEALRVAIAAVDQDAALTEHVTRALAQMDDEQLTAFVRVIAGERAGDFARQVAAQAHTPMLRTRAQGVVGRLAGGGGR